MGLAVLFSGDARRAGRGASLLPAALFRTGAFSAGALVQLLFSASMTGFFFILTLWLQGGEGFSPLLAGLTATAFSLGTIVLAGPSVPLALKIGRTVLVAGGLLLTVGVIAVDVAVQMMGAAVDLWKLVPGLLLGGAGLALLVIPLANVVMAAVPARWGGAAAGVLSTSQQLGGAVGVALIGEVFLSMLDHVGFRAAFEGGVLLVAIGFLACAILSLALPRTAVAEAYG